MASPKELAPLLPETLPEDFGDWDSEASPAPSSVNSSEREAWEAAHSLGETPESLWQSADREAFLESLVDRPRVSSPVSSAPVFVKQQKDFIDWDSESPSAPWPADRALWGSWDAAPSFGKTAKPLEQSADRETFPSPVEDGPRDSGSASSAPVIVNQHELTNQLVDGSPSRASHKLEARPAAIAVPVVPGLPNVAAVDGMRNSPVSTAKTRHEADEAIFQLFSPKKITVKRALKTAKKKWMTVAAVSAGSILLPLILMTPLFHHGTKSVTKHSVQPLPIATDTQLKTNMPNPPASKPLAQGKPLAATEKPPATGDQPANEDDPVTSAQVDTNMMNNQLTAPTRIPKQVAENEPAPPSFSTAGVDALGGGSANAGIFNGHAKPVVKIAPSKPLVISSGVAIGMLIQSTPPAYPPLAKTARMAGTVQLHATISKIGTIKDLHAVSGPVMLRQAALDAVRNWRYKPYMLNNEPIEVETTINVVFTLGG
jgi:protein TonB